MTSKLRQVFVDNPNSSEIAKGLNDTNAKRCAHDRDACFLRCGVRLAVLPDLPAAPPTWCPIPLQERTKWLLAIENEITVPIKKIK